MEAQPANASAPNAVKATLRITAQSLLAKAHSAELESCASLDEQYLNDQEIGTPRGSSVHQRAGAFMVCAA